jgi:hypothetical protein
MMPIRQLRVLGDEDGDGLGPDVPGEGVPPVAGGAAVPDEVPGDPDPALPAGPGPLVPPALPVPCEPWPPPGFPAPWAGAAPVPSAVVTTIVVPGGTGACGAREMTVPAGNPVPAAYSTR